MGLKETMAPNQQISRRNVINRSRLGNTSLVAQKNRSLYFYKFYGAK